MKEMDLFDRKGNVIGHINYMGKKWDILSYFILDFSHDQDYLLLNNDGDKIYMNNYYGYMVIETIGGNYLFSSITDLMLENK